MPRLWQNILLQSRGTPFLYTYLRIHKSLSLESCDLIRLVSTQLLHLSSFENRCNERITQGRNTTVVVETFAHFPSEFLHSCQSGAKVLDTGHLTFSSLQRHEPGASNEWIRLQLRQILLA